VAAGYRKNGGALSISTNGGKVWDTRSRYSGVNYGCSKCFAFDPQDEKILYLAPFNKEKEKSTALGIARSTDQGKNWTLINSGLQDRDVWIIAVNPTNSQQLFAGTGSGNLFRSDNSGKQWIRVSKGLDSTSIRDLTFDKNDPGTIYLSTYSAIFRSRNSGATWEPLKSGLPQGWWNAVIQDQLDATKLYVTGEAGIFQSNDTGKTWDRFEFGTPGTFAVWTLVRDPNHAGRFLAGTDRGVFTYGLPSDSSSSTKTAKQNR
jgi:photosystem II stability/assembly factor-like uncharacterized protein